MSVDFEGYALKTHVETAKTLKNEAAIIGLISQVLSASDVFAFGEILALPNVQELVKTPEGKKHHALLAIFAFGKLSDYKAHASDLPQLTEKQTKKLKQLTLVALASESRVIPYSTLLQELDVPNLTELSDLIIDALYKNLISGKLDHERQEFQVDSAIGRDVQDSDLDRMISVLSAWEKQSNELMKDIEQKIDLAQQQHEEVQRHKTDYDKRLEDIKGQIKAVMEMNMEGALDPEFGNMMGMGFRPRGDKTKGRATRGRNAMV